MNRLDTDSLTQEEGLVAELGLLGIRYLSRESSFCPVEVRPPEALLADLVREPNARIRAAVIAVLLSHPEYADALPTALTRLGPQQRVTLEAFFVAASLLQEEYAHRLRPFMASRWRWLPDPGGVSMARCVPVGGTPRERLAALGREHRRRTQVAVNWTGTYEQVAGQLLRQWECESRWNR